MRIAQVAPLHESVPPRLYGGTERIVSYLTEGLVEAGHEVTLFATADSRTAAHLAPQCPTGLRLAGDGHDPIASHLLMLHEVAERAAEFDVIHHHAGYLHLPASAGCPTPCVTTLHGRLDVAGWEPLHRAFRHLPFVSISDHQRRPMPWLRYVGTVYHGLPEDLLRPGRGAGGYLAFLGRVAREKRPDRAVAIARRVGLPLRVAAKVDAADRRYYEEEIAPLFDDPLVEFQGEVADRDKGAFLGDSLALLFPIDWPEPFGLVMIEAMACGTPVIAWGEGSVPEVIDEGVTGFVVRSVEEAAAAVERARWLDRAACRRRFEERFSVRRMTADYVQVYRRIAHDADWTRRRGVAA